MVNNRYGVNCLSIAPTNDVCIGDDVIRSVQTFILSNVVYGDLTVNLCLIIMVQWFPNAGSDRQLTLVYTVETRVEFLIKVSFN